MFKRKTRKLLKIGKVDVKSALGFFWHDNHKLYVVATPEDIDEWKERGYTEADLHPMSELEFAMSSVAA